MQLQQRYVYPASTAAARAPSSRCLSLLGSRGVGLARQLGARAFRSDDSSMPSSSTARPQQAKELAGPTHTRHTSLNPAKPDDTEPVWRKASFPLVLAITLVSLPFEMAAGRCRKGPRHSGQARNSSNPTASPPKPTADPELASQPPVSVPTSTGSIAAIKQDAAAAAAAVGPQGDNAPQRRLHPSEAAAAAGEVVQAVNAARAAAEEARSAAESSSQASEAAARLRAETNSSRTSSQAAAVATGGSVTNNSTGSSAKAPGAEAALTAMLAAQQSAGPIESWDTSDVGSDEEAEQLAKAMVIQLITHPKDTEAALQAAAAEDGGSGRMSVSPEYIDALVQAVREPSLGMPHSPTPAVDANSSGSNATPAAQHVADTAVNPRAGPPPAAPAAAAATVPPPAEDGAVAGQPAAGEDHPRKRSIWSWLETRSPASSQDDEDEF